MGQKGWLLQSERDRPGRRGHLRRASVLSHRPLLWCRLRPRLSPAPVARSALAPTPLAVPLRRPWSRPPAPSPPPVQARKKPLHLPRRPGRWRDAALLEGACQPEGPLSPSEHQVCVAASRAHGRCRPDITALGDGPIALAPVTGRPHSRPSSSVALMITFASVRRLGSRPFSWTVSRSCPSRMVDPRGSCIASSGDNAWTSGMASPVGLPHRRDRHSP
jgi:hypothetical protein